MTITVYGSSRSPYTRKVLVCLVEKNIEFENEQFSSFAAPDWFADISPLGKIPVLRDSSAGEDATVPDSSVICAYLEDTHAEPALYPSEPLARAQARWYEEFADSALAETVGAPFFFALVVRRLMDQEADRESAEDALKNKMPPRFAYLDRELTGKKYFVGDALTIADIAVACMFVNYAHAGGALDTGLYPNLASFVDRMHARPSFEQFITAEKAFLAKALQGTG